MVIIQIGVTVDSVVGNVLKILKLQQLPDKQYTISNNHRTQTNLENVTRKE